MDVTICFGVRFKKEWSDSMGKRIMEGHAWLLYKGDIYLEKNAEETKTYKMTYCYPENEDDTKEKGLTADIEGLM